ncbi:MBL fold metallo-hydrolase [Formicincola oecophyllae]|uniref:Hydroxyacylglutathione hydrolase n=1 Tax=Formicincola oecophyllae TaxID=2558361 RepID=A0A4Y6U6V0_9PROT|nr:MBL fold metallo-hydrolase [Formicincola oecophyllae]QDH13093.1 MBL fold metallo-hydrolase [Formicincola oecophyllae]
MGLKPFLQPIPLLNDNYAWLAGTVQPDGQAELVLFDPGEGAPVDSVMRQHPKWHLVGLFITHRHGDHMGGALQVADQAHVPLYGPEDALGLLEVKGAKAQGQAPLCHVLEDGQKLSLAGMTVEAISTPGHLNQHLCYLVRWPAAMKAAPALISGDTLFSGGCGRVFEGTPARLFHSIKRLKALPDDVLLCPAHEYTAANLAFVQRQMASHPGLTANLDSRAVVKRVDQVKALRAVGQPSVPVALGVEKATNPFLSAPDEATFTQLRHVKDIS